ncbi:MAG: flagellar hook-basal body complex protein FliE [Deltaproteobacteria bacterium]|nr:flagellar hook-basal body complex protein FliE [Deltaproteobacteria bacterium]
MNPVGNVALNLPAEAAKQAGSDADFTEFLTDALMETQKAQFEADRAMEKLATGDAKSIHEVMVAMEEADISMRMVVQMRNKIVDAYQEIMRMSV